MNIPMLEMLFDWKDRIRAEGPPTVDRLARLATAQSLIDWHVRRPDTCPNCEGDHRAKDCPDWKKYAPDDINDPGIPVPGS